MPKMTFLALQTIVLTVIEFILFHQARGFHYPTFYAEGVCKAGQPSSHVFLIGNKDTPLAGILRSNKGGGTIQSNIDCRLTLQAPLNLKILIEIKMCDFNSAHSDYIKINDHAYVAGCKHGFENSSSNIIDIYYRTDAASYKRYNGFKLYYTVFSEAGVNGQCNKSTPFKFLCKNHRCIWSTLECDGFNNCEDFTDEENCLKVGQKIWITIGVLAVLFLLGWVGYMCYTLIRRRRRRSRDALLARRPTPPGPSIQSPPPSIYPPAQGYQKF